MAARVFATRRWLLPLWIALACLTLVGVACDDETGGTTEDDLVAGDTSGGDTSIGADTLDGDTTGGDTSTDTGGTDTSTDTGEPGDTSTDTGGTDTGSGDTSMDVDVPEGCEAIDCQTGFHCELDASGVGMCVVDTCEYLQCSATERCEVAMPGEPAVCVDISCTTSLDCDPAEFCDGTICQPDTCTPGQRYCAGGQVWECLPDGSIDTSLMACGSPTGLFTSECFDDGTGYAACTCGDDWDCPANTVCEAGLCRGSGEAPTCFLPPEPFTNVLPTPEITWGAFLPEVSNPNLPYSEFIQGSMAPMVANLTDDNGDGLINELDFPEVVFMTYYGTSFTTDGVLRAVHGGGPHKGEDFFASLGTETWHRGDPLPSGYTNTDGIVDPTSSLAIGDIDGDGVPEIVTTHESNGILIYSNTGELLVDYNVATLDGANPSPTLNNIDHQGFAEIVSGRYVFTVERDANGDLAIVDQFSGTGDTGRNGQGPSGCVADILGDDDLEIIAGATVYRLPRPENGWTRRSQCDGTETTPDEVAFCAGQLMTIWNTGPDGFCAIADVLGADPAADPSPTNPLDGVPEVILISAGRLYIYDAADGTERRNIDLAFGGGGGAPNVDDFDGDGFPEIGTAGSLAYVMTDLQSPTAACAAWPDDVVDNDPSSGANNPVRTGNGTACTTDADCVAAEAVCNTDIGQCTCLHNGWRRRTEDNSSRVTGSTLFDFNGDGTAEVVYNDECWFRVYNGIDGGTLFREPSESRTRIEFPIVADVDNDGNAELVFTSNTDTGACSEQTTANQDLYNGGMEVWGDAGDFWVSARRIFNQHSYHVTHVHEDGSIPLYQPPHWTTYAGRYYNAYRSQPRTRGIAPDLVTSRIQVVGSGAGCGSLGDQVDIVAEIRNEGSVRVGPGVVVSFIGTWGGTSEPLLDAAGQPLQFVLQTSLEPGNALLVTVGYDAANNPAGTLPDSVEVVVDSQAQERECDESNNSLSQPVQSGAAQADLSLTLSAPDDSGCPQSVSIQATVTNNGSADASNVTVRFYAGDPSAGGKPLGDEVIAGPIAAGGGTATVSATLTGIPQNSSFTVWAVVDPGDTIAECNDGNNTATSGQSVICIVN